MKYINIILLPVLLLSVTISATAQTAKIQVEGVVLDATTQMPIDNVNISVVGTLIVGTTNQDGQFSLRLAQVPAVLVFSHLGYNINSLVVEKRSQQNIRILLDPEVRSIKEVTINANPVSRVVQDEALQIIDYEISDSRIILLASPFHHLNDQRLYVANFDGDTLSYLPVKQAGKTIKIPELIMPQTEYLFKDFTGQVHFLDQQCAHEIKLEDDRVTFGYSTSYADLLGKVLPVKAEMAGKLFYKVGTMTDGYVWCFGRGMDNTMIMHVEDPLAHGRYISDVLKGNAPKSLDVDKYISIPLFRSGDRIYIFDLFKGYIGVFNADLDMTARVPIDFQNHRVTDGLVFKKTYTDLDNKQFLQVVLLDDVSQRAFAVFQLLSGRTQLKEINLETGAIKKTIEIPDLANVSNIQVYNNVVYFLYDSKKYPYCRSLFHLNI